MRSSIAHPLTPDDGDRLDLAWAFRATRNRISLVRITRNRTSGLFDLVGLRTERRAPGLVPVGFVEGVAPEALAKGFTRLTGLFTDVAQPA